MFVSSSESIRSAHIVSACDSLQDEIRPSQTTMENSTRLLRQEAVWSTVRAAICFQTEFDLVVSSHSDSEIQPNCTSAVDLKQKRCRRLGNVLF